MTGLPRANVWRECVEECVGAPVESGNSIARERETGIGHEAPMSDMLPAMHRGKPPRRLAAGAVVLVALVGAWLGHTLEYLRVVGAAGLDQSLRSGAHAYMLPVGALLALLAALAGTVCWRAWLRLGSRLDGARDALLRAWRGGRAKADPAPAVVSVSLPARLVALWLPLGAVQIGLYLIQENLEAVLSHRTAPGLGPLLGVHAAASAVQLGVALVLGGALLLAGRPLVGRTRELERCERLLRVLWMRRAHRADAPRGARECSPSPIDRFGRQLWRRPPPRSSDATAQPAGSRRHGALDGAPCPMSEENPVPSQHTVSRMTTPAGRPAAPWQRSRLAAHRPPVALASGAPALLDDGRLGAVRTRLDDLHGRGRLERVTCDPHLVAHRHPPRGDELPPCGAPPRRSRRGDRLPLPVGGEHRGRGAPLSRLSRA